MTTNSNSTQIQIHKVEIQEALSEANTAILKKEWSIVETKLIRCLVLLEKIKELQS